MLVVALSGTPKEGKTVQMNEKEFLSFLDFLSKKYGLQFDGIVERETMSELRAVLRPEDFGREAREPHKEVEPEDLANLRLGRF